MLFPIGVIVVLGCVLGGFVLHEGKLGVLYQPTELLIIGGAAIGSFLIGNHMKLVKDVGKSFGKLLKGPPYSKKSYIGLLSMLYLIFKTIKAKGMLAMEAHIENPHESALFSTNAEFQKNHHAESFLCDYLRIMTMGLEDYYQLEELMERDVDIHRKHGEHIAHALNNMADAMPALGIVAAVLGVIITMGSITEPPEILGHLIGGALVGTFLGVLLSYGFVAPMSRNIGAYFEDEVKYIECIKVAMLAHVKGNAPVISIEFARNCLPEHERPSFAEVEEAVNALPPVAA
jgi:chemotaxis protein MotA